MHTSTNRVFFAKHNVAGPRYTSYPTALEFHDEFKPADQATAAKSSPNKYLSLYVHIPFCRQLCYYCGCNKIVTSKTGRAETYLNYLLKEIHEQRDLAGSKQVNQLHFGGGTPSYLKIMQLEQIMSALKLDYDFLPDAEISIEIDPRGIDEDYINGLAKLGFNRLSLGVQDTDEHVQVAINRVQSTSNINRLITRAKAVGFKSVSVDLIYGLPKQTQATFSRTIEDVVAMPVDRVSLFSYAHLPQRFKAQRMFDSMDLPDGLTKTELMLMAIEKLNRAGFNSIGLDHFAKPEDELSLAAAEGTLHRNFQGYTVLDEADLLGFGVSAISTLGASFSQNYKNIRQYYAAIDTGCSAMEKGVKLSSDDFIRAFIIRQLMCNFVIDKAVVNQKFGINFDQYFESELSMLSGEEMSELVEIGDGRVEVLDRAKLLVRKVAMTFDAYLQPEKRKRFSSVL